MSTKCGNVLLLGCVMGVALASARGATATERASPAAPAIVDTISTTGPGVNRPWRLLAGEPWRSAVSFEEIRFGFTAPVSLGGLRVEACRPPHDDLEVAVSVLGAKRWHPMEEDEREGRRAAIYVLEEPAAATMLKVQLGLLGHCLARLVLLDAELKPLMTHVLEPVAATAHSPQTLLPTYDIHRLFDGDFSTAWSTKGDGTAAEIRVELNEPRWLTDIYLWPGYHRSEALWKENAAPATMSVILDEAPPQSFALPTEMRPGAEPRLQLAERVQTKVIVLRIDEVRAGSRYKDTLISELRFADGDHPFIPDPTPALQGHSTALREALAPANLQQVVDRVFLDPDQMWNVGLFGDGRLYLRRYTNLGGDYFRGDMSFEVQKVDAKGALLRAYGTLVRIQEAPDGKRNVKEVTVSGDLWLAPQGDGLTIQPKGRLAKRLPLPNVEYRPGKPHISPSRQALAEAGFPVLWDYTFKAPTGTLKVSFVNGALRITGHLDDPNRHYFTHLTTKRESLEKGRITYALAGNAERIPYRDGKRAGRGTRKKVTGKVIITAWEKGVHLRGEGEWLQQVPLPAGNYELDW